MQNGKHFDFAGLDEWRTDPDRCRDGVPFDMGNGQALIVRRANLFDRAVQAQFETIDNKDTRAVQEVFARVLIVDWQGITNRAGEPIPYSVDGCLALFEYANELWEHVQRFAMNRANYRYQKVQEDIEALQAFRDGAPVQAPTANN